MLCTIGSEAHKERFCGQFIDSHRDFDPESLPWPELDDVSLQRMRAVPFWEEVLHTERRAGRIVKAFARTISDPLVREAIELQGFEEERHARFLGAMVRRYGLAVEGFIRPAQRHLGLAAKQMDDRLIQQGMIEAERMSKPFGETLSPADAG